MTKILIVEDEQALREAYTTLFDLEGFEVHEAINGKEALSLLKAAEPDVILLDVLMPVMNGMEFLEKANLAKTYPKAKVLVLSNLSDPKTLSKIEKWGATYLLKSSASPAQLATAVRDLLKT